MFCFRTYGQPCFSDLLMLLGYLLHLHEINLYSVSIAVSCSKLFSANVLQFFVNQLIGFSK